MYEDEDDAPSEFGVSLRTMSETESNSSFFEQEMRNEIKEDESKLHRKCCSSFNVIISYLLNQNKKQPGSFKIGIFTVFLTVLVITFFESVLSATPILFVKFGQKAVGAIDYSMRSTTNNTSSIKGNVNFYNINPFTSPFHPAGEWSGVWPDPDYKPETDFDNCKPQHWNKEKC